jgi:5-formyltetrahydrofolate cyclo-ligase
MNRDLQQLRAQLKNRRASLEPAEIAHASLSVAHLFWQATFAQRINNVAVYMSAAGEIDCSKLIQTAWLRKKQVFAPILAGKRLKFAPLNPDTKLVPNRFNILEPVYSNSSLIEPKNLDVVVVPLLTFDSELNRVGMGAGYYDRTFAFSKRRHNWRHPLLIGAAYSFQRVDRLRPQLWDVPLHTVITEQGMHRK